MARLKKTINNYEDFKDAVLTLSGIDLNAYKERQMKRRIDALIKKHNCNNYGDFIGMIQQDKDKYEEFINYLTINVSEFYRNPTQWVTLEKEIIPMLLKNKKTLTIWSAACSTGDEPYSVAMVLSKFLPLSSIKIIATDIDKEILEKARVGIYSAKSVLNVPADMKNKFFTVTKELYHVSSELKKCVTFKEHNLLKDPYPQNVDLIICRNVLIYFTEEAKNEIYTKFSQALNKDGILFVGSTEQIILAHKYGFAPHRVFFYKKS